jgi:hypothetical protein
MLDCVLYELQIDFFLAAKPSIAPLNFTILLYRL